MIRHHQNNGFTKTQTGKRRGKKCCCQKDSPFNKAYNIALSMSFTESALSRLKMLIWNGIITHESQTQAKCPSIAKQNLVFSFQFIPPSTTTHTCASLYIHTRIHTYKVCINAYALTQKNITHTHTTVPVFYPSGSPRGSSMHR